MLPGLTLVTGGQASGKSQLAEKLVSDTGRGRVCLAGLAPQTQAHRTLIERRTAARGPGWTVLEEPAQIARKLAGISGENAVLLDCTASWLHHQMSAGQTLPEAEAELMAGLALCAAPVVIVAPLPGTSPDPDAPRTPEMISAEGQLTRKLAEKAGLVLHVVAGLPQVLKGTHP